MKKVIFTLNVVLISILTINAQSLNKFGKGISVTGKDSSFAMKFSTRFQNLFISELDLEDNEIETNFLVRRARLKFSGFAHSPKLQYKVELGLSNRDHGSPIPETKNTARIILDAVVKWEFMKNTSLWVGQTKLPGNRERLISSQKLQFVDRSLLNSKYNIDRDMGIQLHHHCKIGGMIIREKISLSQGEGRNITTGNYGGYDYTGRLEFLPFGNFRSKGDYFGADLKRGQKPKLAIGFTYDYNDNASREHGNSKDFLPHTRTLSTIFADAMFKYKGVSVMAEYANKVTTDGTSWVVIDTAGVPSEYFYTGTGLNCQIGYLFKKNWEVAGRYTFIQPSSINQIDDIAMYTLGFSRYIVEHNLKIQTDVSLTQQGTAEPVLMHRLQLELAF
jgi:hypothetical protein